MDITACRQHPAIKEVATDPQIVRVFKQLEDWTTRKFTDTPHKALLYNFRPNKTRLTDFLTKYEEISKYFKRHNRDFSEQELRRFTSQLDHLANTFENCLNTLKSPNIRSIQESYILSAGDHFFTFDDQFENVPLTKKQNDAIRPIFEGLLELLNALVDENTGDFQITDEIAQEIWGLAGLGSEETFSTYGGLVGSYEIATPQEFFGLVEPRYWVRDGYGEWFNTLLESLG